MFTDEQRMKFIMQDCESYLNVDNDRYDYAVEVAEENDRYHPTEDDELEGFRRMVDAAMTFYKFKE